MSQIPWSELLDRSLDYSRASETLESAGLLQPALEQSFLALELMMKAAIAFEGGQYPLVHDLALLSQTKVRNRKISWNRMREVRWVAELFAEVGSYGTCRIDIHG